LGPDPSHILFLSLPDRVVPSYGGEAERAAEAIAHEARQVRASALFVSWRHDPHCDHQACYAIACAAQRRLPDGRLFGYSIWGRVSPLETVLQVEPRGWRLSSGDYRARKRAAIACHRSQLSDLITDDP
jgi:LmbE family N-acetylglucosaminyl deacetylase